MEQYNENGLLKMTVASGFDTIVYEHDHNGMVIKCYEIIDGSSEVRYTATYKDTIITEENWDSSKNYKQKVLYDKKGRRIKDLKLFKESKHIDSTITTYFDNKEKEVRYEKGKVRLLINSTIYGDSTIRKYYKISEADTIHYLSWSNYFDVNGNRVKRKQLFLDRTESTEYLNEFNDQGKLRSSSTLKNGVVKFKTNYERNKDGELIRTINSEKGYRTITRHFYSPNGFDKVSFKSIYRNSVLSEKQVWFEDYTFYNK